MNVIGCVVLCYRVLLRSTDDRLPLTMMSSYSSAWLDASAAAAASYGRSHQLYVDDDCIRPAASCSSLPLHNHRYDVKQFSTQLPSAAYNNDRYSLYGSYSSCGDCSPPSRGTALTMHGRLVFDSTSDLQHDCTDVELTQHVDQQHANNNNNGT